MSSGLRPTKLGDRERPVLVVGGGLAGLTACRLLRRNGIGFQLLEARQRLGGRILTVGADGEPASDGFDLGPSWFWPQMQPELGALISELGLAAFPQQAEGDVVVQLPGAPPRRYRAPVPQDASSMRLVGGTRALIDALSVEIPTSALRLGMRVIHVTQDDGGVAVEVSAPDGTIQAILASHVIFAVPPRLLAATVTFSPALDPAVAGRWSTTPTWMAPHAKVFALYERPFWRDTGLSGSAQSRVGPLVEIHDATTSSGQAGLFGFVGIQAVERAAIGEGRLVAACVNQLAQLFGPSAGAPRATLVKDWSADPLTATAEDRFAGDHPEPDARPWVDQVWSGRVSLAGSETSRSAPGYLAGAVDAAYLAVADVIGRWPMGFRPAGIAPAG